MEENVHDDSNGIHLFKTFLFTSIYYVPWACEKNKTLLLNYPELNHRDLVTANHTIPEAIDKCQLQHY